MLERHKTERFTMDGQNLKKAEEEQIETEEVEIEEVEETKDGVEADENPNDESGDNDNSDDADEGDQPEDETFEVSLETAAPADDLDDNAEDTPVLKHVRDKYREEQKARKAAEARLAELEAKQEVKTPTLGAKPKIEDFDYDEEEYEPALEKWLIEKQADDKRKAAVAEKQEAGQKVYQGKLDSYHARKAELNIEGYDEGESRVRNALSVEQQGIIIAHAKDPNLVILALMQNPTKLKALSEQSDLIGFGIEMSKMERNMKTKHKSKPLPESKIRGGTASFAGDKTLEALEKEADRTGDRTKVQAFKREQRKLKQK